MDKLAISREMLIEDLVKHYPDSVSVLMEYDVQCIACGEPVWGTLGEKIENKNLDWDPIREALAEVGPVVSE
ncbi:MAG: hypothetical protein MAGBODY4_00099 [Candidatus Marinimicrobia bacterium]|nr:hypothetical protein [Candidatus Neomarinimicrobiota bacterium]